MEELNKLNINTGFIMITGYPTIKTALEALKLGAHDYITKPFTRTELLSPIYRFFGIKDKNIIHKKKDKIKNIKVDVRGWRFSILERTFSSKIPSRWFFFDFYR